MAAAAPTFTRSSQDGHAEVAGAPLRQANLPCMTTRTSWEKLHRSAVLAFMAMVTVGLVALALGQSGSGAAGVPGLVVYSFAAGFGLEFVGSAWRWDRAHPDDAGA